MERMATELMEKKLEEMMGNDEIFRHLEKRLEEDEFFRSKKVKEGWEDSFLKFYENYLLIEKTLKELREWAPDYSEGISLRLKLVEDLTRTSIECFKEIVSLLK